ncbi:MAG: adenylate/guanylate cyclase domain-containing protein [Candidatus Tectomicrobia bacterium]
MERKLTAILYTDVKGYSRLMGADEETTIRTLTTYRQVMSDLIPQHRGRVVDATGDNLLAEFASVVDAVRCATEIQREFRTRNAELPPERKMEFRIGVNLGDVVVEGDQIYGDGINIAARLESLAEGGGICISGAVYDQIGNKLDLEYTDLGVQAMKNIAKPVQVYRVQLETHASPPTMAQTPVHDQAVNASPPTAQRWWKAVGALLGLLLILAGIGIVWYRSVRAPTASQEASPQKMPTRAYLMSISGPITRMMAPYTRRVLHQAQQQGANAVILRLNTLGGHVDAAIQIRDVLLHSDLKTITFIDKMAVSAGALIALASQQIYMTEGGAIGAATAMSASGQPVGEKHVPALRTLFQVTAEHHHRPGEIAAAMVDKEVAIPGLVAAGELLRLSTQEALQWKVADGYSKNLEALLAHLQLSSRSLVRVHMNWEESLVDRLNSQPVSAVLLIVGLLALVVELTVSGLGVGGVISLLSFSLFFGSHYLAGLAGWEELLVIAVGIVLLAAEMFLIPGFGVAGILGVVALGAGLYFSFLGSYATPAEILHTGFILLGVFALSAIGFGMMLVFGAPTSLWSRLRLKTQLAKAAKAASSPQPLASFWLGAEGITVTPLMPSGAGLFQDTRLDIISEGAYIPGATPVRIIHTEGNWFVVRPIELQ